MKIRQIFIVILFFCSTLSVAAQTAVKRYEKPRRLNIGDKVPSIPFTIVDLKGNVIKGNVANYNNKLLIIDMLSTHCGGCIGGLPKKDSLQKEFGDKIKIIVSTPENAAYIENYLANKQSYLFKKGVQLPWIFEDQLLERYFPYVTVSHIAWIYKGTVVAITDQEYVDETNIKKILSGEIVNLPVKYEVLGLESTSRKFKQHMFSVGLSIPSDESSQTFYSIASGYQSGLIGFSGNPVIDSAKKTIWIYLSNAGSLLRAYGWACNGLYAAGEKQPFLSKARLLLEVEDPAHYVYDPSLGYLDAWSRKNGVCYEGVFPLERGVKAAYQKMIIDLDAFFGTHARWEMRKVPCWVITQTSSDEEIKKRTEENKQYTYLDTIGRAHNGKSGAIGREYLLRKLSFENSFKRSDGKELPVVIDCNYKGTIILHFDDLKTIESLQAALKQYGFDVKEGERETEMFVLTELKR